MENIKKVVPTLECFPKYEWKEGEEINAECLGMAMTGYNDGALGKRRKGNRMDSRKEGG